MNVFTNAHLSTIHFIIDLKVEVQVTSLSQGPNLALEAPGWRERGEKEAEGKRMIYTHQGLKFTLSRYHENSKIMNGKPSCLGSLFQMDSAKK